MPKTVTDNKLPHILYSCYSHVSRGGEQFVAQHVFSYMLAGSQDMYMSGNNYLFKQGDFRFIRKNQLCRYVKYPPAGGEFQAISILIDDQTLRSMSAENNLHMEQPYIGEGALLLQPNPLFKNYINSLTPYLNSDSNINSIITTLKVKEAIMILLQTNPELKNILFDFSEPGKIDLEAYMNEHYRFNVDLSRFAYLTGRSLATFKRDFEKIYHISPSRWLQQRRLQEAHYLIKEKGQAPSAVYLELGFEDLSHFSYAFKKTYGVAPSRI